MSLSLEKNVIVAGADNRPPMLDKTQYSSWASLTEPGTATTPATVRDRRYNELTDAEKIREPCDIKATNIILQGLPQDIYNLVNQYEKAKYIWDRVKLLIECSEISLQERDQSCNETNSSKYKVINHLQPEWIKFVTDVKLAKDLHGTNFDQLYAYLRQHEAHANEVRIMKEQFLNPLSLRANTYNSFPSYSNQTQYHQQLSPFASQQQVSPLVSQKLYDFMTVQKRQNQGYVGNGARSNATVLRVNKTGRTNTEAFETNDLDAFDSDCDEASSASVVLMAKLSSYDSKILSELPIHDIYLINHMKSYLDTLEHLGYSMPNELGMSLILNSLNKNYDQFAQNYTMHSTRKTIAELHDMLKLHVKGTLKKAKTPTVLAIWEAELKKRKNASVASTLGIFTIDFYAFPNKTWVYDTGCGTHICNTSQGLRGSRKLKHGALSLYMGNGMRAVVEAIGSFDLRDGILQPTHDESLEKCKSCISGKMARKPFPHQVERAKDLLGLIYTYVCSSFRTVSREGASYFITFTYDFSSYGDVYLMKHKHEVFEAFKCMRTRSKSYLNNSNATIPRRSNRRRVPNIAEPEIRTIEEIVPMADRTMEELLQSPTEGYGEAIVIPEILAENFKIKTNLLQLVQTNKFHGFERDNPHTHISNFKRMTSTLKYRDVPIDAVKLMLFPYSLEGAARIWYEKEPPDLILTWDDLVNKFINQFFPPSKTTHLKNEISRFTQRFDETFGEAWERFKKILKACPHHEFSKLTQIDTFYNGLNEQDQDYLNATAGGNLLSKMTREALKIIENKSKFRYSRSKSNVSRVNTRDSASKTDDRIDKLADQISNLVEIVNKQVITLASAKAVEKTCVICGGAHAYYDFIATDSNKSSVCAAIGSFFQNQASTSGILPSNIVPNPKGEMKAVTTRNGLAYEGPSIPINSPLEKVVERDTEETTDKEHSNCEGSTAHVQPPVVPISIPKPDVLRTQPKPNIPYQSRLNDQKLREKATNQMEKFFQIFLDLHFDISFAEALFLMPKFASTIKSLLTNKDKLFELAKVPLNENCSAMLLKNLPEKLGDPDKFLIPCDFSGIDVCYALADLADRSITRPKGVAKDVFVNVGKFHFPTDFVVVDFEADPRVSLILGRSFLRADRALIDVYGEEITLRVNGKSVTFNLNQTMRYSSTYDDNSVNRVDVIDIACEEFVQDVFDFQYNSKSSNPTLVSNPLISKSDFCKEPIVKSSSPTLTPFGESDFFLEEIEDFLNDESIPTRIKNSFYDPNGDILYLEKLLKEDPFQLPSMDLKQAEETKAKSSIKEPPELELKELLSHLEYAFLEYIDKLPVIIAKDLNDVEKEALIKVLKSHKRAIAWKIFDIKGIDLRFYTHKILMEEDYKPAPVGESDTLCAQEGWHTIVANGNNELISTRLVTGWRVCIDYRKLNDATRKDHFSLPFMDQMLERLAGNKFYCFLDGFSRYFQILIDPQDQETTNFTCPYGTFAYRRMPFGLCNAPSTFQRCMTAIFHDMIDKTMEVFMDDFSIFGDSFYSCLTNLDKMLKRCEDTNLVLNWEKCHFMCREGIVLGHKISKSGIKVDRVKVDVIAKLPHPTTVKGVRSFLGHAGFYRRFIQAFSKIARQMTHLLEDKTPFVFSKECVDAFNTLKKKLTESPILVVPDWNLPFDLMCDASDFAIGTVLGQRSENLAADHLSRLENPHKDVLENKDINENFPLETLGSLSSNSTLCKYILVAVDYLSKWVEAKALPTNNARVVVKILKSLFSRFGIPRAIISDRWTHFFHDQFTRVMIKYGVTHRLATAYHPQTSGQVEVSNRGLKRILERTVGENHASWSDKLDDALWAFRTAFKTPIGCTPYKLAYENSVIYKERSKKLHYSKIKNRIFNVSDQVLLFNSRLKIFSGKLKTRWLGPFTITQVFPYGTIELSQPNGPNFKVNGHHVKHYFGGDIPSKVVPDLHTIFPTMIEVSRVRCVVSVHMSFTSFVFN
uniref:DNA-directed DNA polymerase n=1 Tax=Tanacetum cinerariifolium TaxID=118510 RepID=A0A6L2J6G5_TANCI|nr:DNA-directed DNA polymerase [Tanacetum cinerariifolium]